MSGKWDEHEIYITLAKVVFIGPLIQMGPTLTIMQVTREIYKGIIAQDCLGRKLMASLAGINGCHINYPLAMTSPCYKLLDLLGLDISIAMVNYEESENNVNFGLKILAHNCCSEIAHLEILAIDENHLPHRILILEFSMISLRQDNFILLL